eukprot:5452218-Pyramimonas_sp.AAC.2
MAACPVLDASRCVHQMAGIRRGSWSRESALCQTLELNAILCVFLPLVLSAEIRRVDRHVSASQGEFSS